MSELFIAGSEGRAGMAAIVDEDRSLNLQDLASALQRSLPPYARPLFVRLLNEVDTTGKYKTSNNDNNYFYSTDSFILLQL